MKRIVGVVAISLLFLGSGQTTGKGSSHSSSSHSSGHSHSTYSTHTSTHSHSTKTTSPHSTHSKSSSTRCSTCPRDEHGNIKRSGHAKDEFKKSHPCPSTGKTSGSCPGYVIDHIHPLAKGGADAPSNMQWQTKAAAKEKDKWERK